MVKVPEYQQSVDLRPEFRQDVDVRATPESFGADIGKGLDALGKGADTASDALFKVQQIEDVTRAKDADNRYAEWVRNRQFGEGGYMTLEGKNAVDGRTDFEREAAEKRKEYGQGLPPGAARAYDTASTARLQSTLQQSIVHSAQARKQWVGDASAARVQSFGDDALVNFNNPKAVTKNLAAGILELRQNGELHGWGADTQSQKEKEFVSGVHKNITLRMAQTDPVAAEKYMRDKADFISGADMYSLEHGLKGEIQNEQSKRHADEILQGGRKTDAGGPTAPASRTMGQTGPSSARALLAGKLTAGHAKDHIDGLDEGFATNLSAMMQDAPPEIREGLGVMSGYRSVDRQQQLWDDALLKYGSPEAARKWVAPPGSSKHNHGQAVDLAYNGESLSNAPKEVVDWVHQNAGRYGLYFPMAHEPWHVEPVGSRSGTVSPRNTVIAPRAAMASYDDIEGQLAAIKDPKVRDLTRQRVMAGIEIQNKASEARERQAKAELWNYIDQGKTPDQVPMEVRQAAGMGAVTSAWSYMDTVRKGRDIQSDEEMVYGMRRAAAMDPEFFAKVDLNDYRDKLSRADIKELSGLQTSALTDQRKAREDGLNLTAAFSQAEQQLAAVGISTAGKKGPQLDEANKRVASFNNALSAQMDEFKRANSDRKPTQADIQSMINRLLLPVVVKTPGTLWGTNTWAPPGVAGTFTNGKTFAFDAASRPDNSTADVAVKYADIPIDLRRGIAGDLERELGRKPSEVEVTKRYQDFVLNR